MKKFDLREQTELRRELTIHNKQIISSLPGDFRRKEFLVSVCDYKWIAMLLSLYMCAVMHLFLTKKR